MSDKNTKSSKKRKQTLEQFAAKAGMKDSDPRKAAWLKPEYNAKTFDIKRLSGEQMNMLRMSVMHYSKAHQEPE